MTLLWIGNLVLIAVVVPVVLVLLNRLMRPVVQIRRESEAILAGGAVIATQLDLVAGLVPTRDSIKQIGAGVAQYGAALDKIL
jgi:uncharacterized membrane protein YvlD (DUF360 family)